MKVTIETISGCKRLIRVEVPAEEVEQHYRKALREVARHVRMPGFRPGKAPLPLVEKSHQKEVLEEARAKLVDETFRAALKEHDLRPATRPEFEADELKDKNADYAYIVTMEIAPQFETPDYKNLPVKVEDKQVTEADLERALRVLQEDRATFQDVDRPLQSGDFAVVSFQGSCEGKPLTDYNPATGGLTQQNDYWIHIQPDEFLPGFTEQLVGAKPGEKRTVKVTFPPEFEIRELAGKEAVYEVEIRSVKEKTLPPLDDAFARSYQAASLEELKKGVLKNLEQELEFKKRQDIRNQLIATLLGRVHFDLPESIVEAETRSLVYDMVKRNTDRGVPREEIEKKKDEIYKVANNAARERVKLMFLVQKIAEKEGIEVTREELSREVVVLAVNYGVKPQTMAEELQRRGGFGEIQEQILQRKVLEKLEQYAQIETVPAGMR